MIEFLPLLKRRFDNEIRIGPILCDIALRHDDNIFGESETHKMTTNLLGCLPSMNAVWHDHQYIKVAIRPHRSSSCGSKKNDAEGVNRHDDPPHQLFEQLCVWFHEKVPRKQNVS